MKIYFNVFILAMCFNFLSTNRFIGDVYDYLSVLMMAFLAAWIIGDWVNELKQIITINHGV